MARVFLIFSILIGLGAAFLGFKTKQQAEALQASVTEAKEQASTAQAAEKKAKTDLTSAQKSLEETQTELKSKEEEATKAKADAQEASSKLADVQRKATEAEQQLASIQSEVDKLRGESGGKVSAAEMAARIQEANDAKTKLETELQESKQVQQTLQQRADELQAQFADKDRQIAEYKQEYTRAGLTGRVLAYNPGWNFVVLNIGDKSGVKSGAQLVVTRSGSLIGKVRVTTVEPSTSIADVLPGTLAAGESVQPGDSVVFEGKNKR